MEKEVRTAHTEGPGVGDRTVYVEVRKAMAISVVVSNSAEEKLIWRGIGLDPTLPRCMAGDKPGRKSRRTWGNRNSNQ